MTLFPEIESALVRAVERDIADRVRQPPWVRSARDWLRARQHGLVVVLAALVTAGAATAAVTLSGQASRPLQGTFRAYGPAGTLGSMRYAIGGLVPSLEPGRVGWCVTYLVDGTIRLGSGKTVPSGQGSGGCSYASAIGRPIFASDEGHGPGLHFFLTAPDVAAVRVNGRLTILTRPDQGLPFGLRAAVFETRLDPGLTPSVVALDQHGHAIQPALPALPAAHTISWRAPHRQPGGACSLTIRTSGGLRVLAGIAVRTIVPAPGIQGRAFVSCVELELIDGQFFMEAAVLLDAARPGSPPAPLPGVRPVPGHPGWFDWPNPQAPLPGGGDRGLNPGFDPTNSNLTLFDPDRAGLIPMPDGGLSARRVGNAWLVVQGGAGTAQRLAALAALNPAPVELPAPVATRRPAEARCWLNSGQLPGLTPVDEAQEPDRLLPRRLGGECFVAASFYLNGWPIEALYGAPKPPSATFWPEPPGARQPILTVRRGRGWLQVIGGSGPTQRRELAANTIVGR